MKKKYLIYVYSLVLLTTGIIVVSWRMKAARIAETFVGILETGNNSGFADAAFQQMMTDVGWLGGEAWCMYFAKAVYLQAFPSKVTEITRVLSGSTQLSWRAAMAPGSGFKAIVAGSPKTGDIAIWQSVSDPSKGHAGIVGKKISANNYRTVEGNSGLGGTSSGQGVTTKTRVLIPGTIEGDLKLLGFLRLKTFI